MAIDNQVHISNNTNFDVRVLVAPNEDFLIGDIVATCATTVLSAIATDGASLGEIPEEIKTFSDLIKLFKAIKTFGTVVSLDVKALEADAAAAIKQLERERAVHELLENAPMAIHPAHSAQVLRKVLYNPLDYMGPSGWAAIAGGREIHLLVLLWSARTQSLLNMVDFNTNSDSAWLVDLERGVLRVKHGHLWVEEPEGPAHPWKFDVSEMLGVVEAETRQAIKDLLAMAKGHSPLLQGFDDLLHSDERLRQYVTRGSLVDRAGAPL